MDRETCVLVLKARYGAAPVFCLGRALWRRVVALGVVGGLLDTDHAFIST
jgi:hypothetical protein